MDQCSAEVYSGELCRPVLTARQSCIPGRENSSEVLVLLTPSLRPVVEQQLTILLQLVQPSPECGEELLAFLCLEALAGFCDSSGAVHRSSRQECERVTTRTCAREFLQILPILQESGTDMSCESFPEESSVCSSSGKFATPALVCPQTLCGHDTSMVSVYRKPPPTHTYIHTLNHHLSRY